MKKWIFRILSTAVVLLWMSVIFGFSGQQAKESSGLSEKVSRAAVTVVNKAGHMEWDENTVTAYAEKIEYPVRKCAHMTEYAILSLLVFVMFGTYGMPHSRIRYVSSILYVFCYASTDEFHQLFVPGRSGQFTDVCIDTTGAILAMLLLSLLCRVCRRKNSNNRMSYDHK